VSIQLGREDAVKVLPKGEKHWFIAATKTAVAFFEEIRDPLAVANARFWEAIGLWSVGRHVELVETVNQGLARAEQSGNSFMTKHLEMIFWLEVARTERAAEAVSPLTRLSAEPLPTVAWSSLSGLALALLTTGDTARAEIIARESVDKSRAMPPLAPLALSTLALVLLTQGRVDESIAAADEALACLVGTHPSFIEALSTKAQALEALGRIDEAHTTIRDARDRLLRTAATLEPDDRQSYLGSVDVNVRILRMAKEWPGDS
jgi:tetratricopeptide (TPR) repeat protein